MFQSKHTMRHLKAIDSSLLAHDKHLAILGDHSVKLGNYIAELLTRVNALESELRKLKGWG
jgi:hypothetical protein